MDANTETTHNSKVIIFFAPRRTGERRQQQARIMMPQMHFSEALATCPEAGDIVSSLCKASSVAVGYLALERAWPWLKQVVEVPCGCSIIHPSALMVLCHLFDRHVIDLKDWSMPQLVEWGTRTQDIFEGPER